MNMTVIFIKLIYDIQIIYDIKLIYDIQDNKNIQEWIYVIIGL